MEQQTSQPGADRMRVFAAAVLGVVCVGGLLWPLGLNGAVFMFFDSASYFKQGEAVLDLLLGIVAPATNVEGDSVAGAEAAGVGDFESVAELRRSATSLRSVPYGVFAHVSAAVFGGAYGVAVAQALVLTVLVAPFFAGPVASRPWTAAAVFGLLAATTTAAWYVSFAMPDVFAVVVIVFAWLLLEPIERLPWWAQWLWAGVAAFAVAAHYGHIPLAVAVIGAALFVRLLTRRLTWRIVALGAAPICVALAVNAAIGAVATRGQGVSVAPLRLPLLLARSIEDGPARWHLQRACPEAGYAVCEVFADGVPDNVGSVMWGRRGLSNVDKETIERVRAEELTILVQAFAEHPVEQLWSLGGNAARQMVFVGVADHRSDMGRRFALVHLASYLIGLLGVAAAVSLRRGAARREAAEFAFVLAVALLTNAAVFGGLSAPVDRYGGRIAWLAPALAVVLWWPPSPSATARGSRRGARGA